MRLEGVSLQPPTLLMSRALFTGKNTERLSFAKKSPLEMFFAGSV